MHHQPNGGRFSSVHLDSVGYISRKHWKGDTARNERGAWWGRDYSYTYNADGAANVAASTSRSGGGGGTRLSRYNKRWSDIITPLVTATVDDITGTGSRTSSSSSSDASSLQISSSDATAAAPSLTATSQSANPNNVTIMIVYGPEYHHYISQFAWEVAKGVLSSYHTHRHGVTGQLLFGHTDNLTFWDVVNADAIIVGSPVYNGNTHPNVQQWINNFQIQADLSRKVGAAFVTAGGLHAGADGTLMSILRSLMIFQMVAVGGASWDSPFGAAATVYEEPFGDQNVAQPDFASACYENFHGTIHPHFLHKAYQLGVRVANITFALANSSE